MVALVTVRSRLLKSLAFAAVSLLPLIAAVPLGDLAADAPTPLSFSIAASQPGDRLAYETFVARVNGDALEPLAGPRDSIQLERLADGSVRDADGVDRRTVRWAVPTFSGEQIKVGRIFAADLESGALIATTEQFTGDGGKTTSWTTIFAGIEDRLVCGLSHALQGRTIVPGATTGFAGDCGFDEVGIDAAHASPWSTRPTAVEGRTSLLLESPVGPHPRVWIEADIPYPTWIEVPRSRDPSIVDVQRLTAFSPGADAAPVAVEPSAEVAPLQWTKGVAMGPAGGRGAVAFGLHDAITAARLDPLVPGFASFLRDRPNAIVHGAVGSTEVKQAGATLQTTWHVHVTDGVDTMRLTSVHQSPRGLAVGTTRNMIDGPVAAEPGLDPSRAPERLPTFDSVAARWRGYAREDVKELGANLWTYHLAPTETGPLRAIVRAGVGSSVVDPTRDTWDINPPASTRESHLAVDADGRAVSFVDRRQQQAAALSSLAEARPADETPSIASIAPTRAWVAPARTWATGASLLAVAAAALYAAWPLVRGAFPFFTRVESPQVLAHPVRQKLMAYVEAQPGTETNAMARALGLAWGHTLHHVHMLRRSGHLRVRRVGGRTALFPVKPEFLGNEERIVLLRKEGVRRIHDYVREHAGARQADVAGALGLGQPWVSKALARLERCGLVRSERRDGVRAYFTAAPAPHL